MIVSTPWFQLQSVKRGFLGPAARKKTLEHNRSIFVQNSSQLPKARKDKLIIKELDDETLVYDLDRDKAHCLNTTAARVWKHCDGTTTVGEIAASLSGGATTEPNENVV